MAATASFSSAISRLQRHDLVKPSVITALTVVAILLTLYSFQHRLGDFLLLLYLPPLLLASIWYPRRGLLLIAIVVAGSFVAILYTTWSGLSPNPLQYSLYAAVFVWIIAATTVFTMEGRTALSHALNSLRRMQTGREDRRTGGSRMAGETGRPLLTDEDLGYVLDALKLPDTVAREVAIRSLGKSGDPRAVAPLVALLGDGNRGTREQTVRALGSLGKVAVEPLLRALGDPDWHVRTGAAVALRIIGDARAIEPLIRALGDGNRFVRREAAKSLGRIGDARVVEPLIRLLQDQDTGVRGRAVIALGRLGDLRAREPLLKITKDPDPDIQLAVMDAISKLKN